LEADKQRLAREQQKAESERQQLQRAEWEAQAAREQLQQSEAEKQRLANELQRATAEKKRQVKAAREDQGKVEQARREKAERESELQKQQLQHQKIELRSAKGIDYRELEKLLKNQEWRKADELTVKHMLKVANREKEGWLDTEHIEAFPCEDLRTIDQLWVHYSNSKFGLSIQKKLWLECGGEIGKYDHELWKKFAAKVGWYHPQNNYWRTYTKFMNDTQNARNALPASLPSGMVLGWKTKMLRTWKDVTVVWRWKRGYWLFSSLAQRLVNCNG
jgi:hypothetical protein